MWQIMMRTHCMSNYYLCDFLKIIDNKNREKQTYYDVYILHIERYDIRTYSRLGR
jgi:hypothetical protein